MHFYINEIQHYLYTYIPVEEAWMINTWAITEQYNFITFPDMLQSGCF